MSEPGSPEQVAGQLSRAMEHVEQRMRQAALWWADRENIELRDAAMRETYTASRLAVTTVPYGQAMVGLLGTIAQWMVERPDIDPEEAISQIFKMSHEQMARTAAAVAAHRAGQPIADKIDSVEDLLKRETEGAPESDDGTDDEPGA